MNYIAIGLNRDFIFNFSLLENFPFFCFTHTFLITFLL